MPRVKSPGDGRVWACPNCDRAGDIYHRDTKIRREQIYIGDPDDPYSCMKCQTSFKEPVLREAKPSLESAYGAGHGNLSVDQDLLDRVREATAP